MPSDVRSSTGVAAPTLSCLYVTMTSGALAASSSPGPFSIKSSKQRASKMPEAGSSPWSRCGPELESCHVPKEVGKGAVLSLPGGSKVFLLSSVY